MPSKCSKLFENDFLPCTLPIDSTKALVPNGMVQLYLLTDFLRNEFYWLCL